MESIIGSKTVKESYIKELVSKWCEELTKLSEIAKTQPQAAYAALTSRYRHKFSYFMQKINYISHFMSPVERIIKEKLIPALFGGFPISKEFRKLLALPYKSGGTGITAPTKNANKECNNSMELAGQLINIKSFRSSIKKKRKDKHLNILTLLRTIVQQIQKIERYWPRTRQFKLASSITY